MSSNVFLTKLRTLCEECDWIVKCGYTRNGYLIHYNTSNAEAIYNADIVALYTYARNVVSAGRRSSVASHRAVAEALDKVLTGDYTIANIINTFEGIV
jgi:hypothetical protein